MSKKLYIGIAAGAALLLVAAAGLRALYSVGELAPVAAAHTTLPTMIIDSGHGGLDGGAVGVDGIVEKDINLAIGLVMRDLFTVSGFDVVMTRDTDISIHDEDVKGTRSQKTSDLRNRLAMMEAHPGAIFISIHQNKFEDSRSRGAQIFYGGQNENSERLARILQDRFAAGLQPDNKRQIKKAGKNLFLMYNAKCPAVLVECGFLSNAEEARMLTDSEYQSKIAFTAFASVMEFLELDAAPMPGEDTARPEPTL